VIGPTTARCGCLALSTVSGRPASTRPALIQAARDNQRAQHCPAAGMDGRGFDEDGMSGYATAAQDFADTTGCEPVTTCPLACLFGRGDGVESLLSAMGAAADYGIPIPESLGRPMLPADHEAIARFRAARAARDAAERSMIESERQAREAMEADRRQREGAR